MPLQVAIAAIVIGVASNEAIGAPENGQNKNAVINTLNRIMELELAGVVRYTYYSLMVYGYNRIPTVDWLQKQVDESLVHSRQTGVISTWLGGYPSLTIGSMLESHKHDIGDILREPLEHERGVLKAYYDLFALVEHKDIRPEERSWDMIATEVAHADEVEKMLRKPGQNIPFCPSTIQNYTSFLDSP